MTARLPGEARTNLRWPPILELARAWVEAQPHPVTLRQTFYHLVATQVIPNSEHTYRRLSSNTAAARREDGFPDFADETHSIDVLGSWADVEDFAGPAAAAFHLDRAGGQDFQVVVGVEKRGMAAAAKRLFAGRGWAVTALGGYGSQTIKGKLVDRIEDDGRESVLIYAGDFDASGEDLLRDFVRRVEFDRVIRAALTVDQVAEYDLPENPGKATDPRSKDFAAKYGTNVQVEVDALDPATLDRLMIDAAAPFWNTSRYQQVITAERAIQQRIRVALQAA